MSFHSRYYEFWFHLRIRRWKRTWQKQACRVVWMGDEVTMARQLFPWLLSHSLFGATIMIVSGRSSLWSSMVSSYRAIVEREYARCRKYETNATAQRGATSTCVSDRHVYVPSRLNGSHRNLCICIVNARGGLWAQLLLQIWCLCCIMSSQLYATVKNFTCLSTITFVVTYSNLYADAYSYRD